MREEILPFYLSIGVDEERFWISSPKDLEPYKKAFEKRQEYDNYLAWVQGLYIQNAVASIMSKKVKYPKKPFGIEEQNDLTEDETGATAAKKFEEYITVYNRRFEKTN